MAGLISQRTPLLSPHRPLHSLQTSESWDWDGASEVDCEPLIAAAFSGTTQLFGDSKVQILKMEPDPLPAQRRLTGRIDKLDAALEARDDEFESMKKKVKELESMVQYCKKDSSK